MAQTLREKYQSKSQEQQNLNEAFDAKAVQAASSIIKRIANSFKGVQGFDNLIKAKNNIIELDVAETQRWRRTAGSVETDWVNEMKGKSIDGAKLVSEARALIAKHSR